MCQGHAVKHGQRSSGGALEDIKENQAPLDRFEEALRRVTRGGRCLPTSRDKKLKPACQ